MKTSSGFLLVFLLGFAALSCRKPPTPQKDATASATGGQAATPDAALAPPKPMPPQLPDVLARVNGEPVRKVEFDRVVRNIELGNGPIPADRRDEVLRGVLDQLITYTVMSQEAKTQNVTVTDTDVDSRIKQMRGTTSDDEFKKALAARGMSVEQLRSDARTQLTIEKMMEAQIANTGAATEVDARAFYDNNPDKFKQAATVRASHILLKVPENAPEAEKTKARTQIEGILKRARSGEDFAALAKQYSQDGSSAQGGDLGHFERERMVPPFSQAAFALQPGQLSDVVATQFGFHIIKVTDRKPPSAVPYEQVSARIVDYLSSQKKQQRMAQLIQDAKKRARIEVLV